MTTATKTIATSLTVDPARWREYLVDRHSTVYGQTHTTSVAEREVVATASAIIRDGRPVHSHHNSDGTWAVRIDETTGKYVRLMWSHYTLENDGTKRHITRGEAVVVMCHEMFHVLFTDEVNRPDWCKPEHWKAFFPAVNFAEDVRIEDKGESVVPVFSTLRQVENDRMMPPNATNYNQFDFVRKVLIVLYAERCCTNAHVFAGLPDAEVQAVIDGGRQSFVDATNAADTASLLEALRPLYDLLAPYMDAPTGGGGEPGGDDADGDDSDGGDPVEGGDGGTTGKSSKGDADTDTDASGGGSGDESDDADDTDTDGSGDSDTDDADDDSDGEGGDGEDGDGEDADGADTKDKSDGGGDGGDGDPLPDAARPDRQRGEWEKDRPDDSRISGDEFDKTLNGDQIIRRVVPRGWTADPRAEQRMLPTTRNVLRTLRRTLQDNANGGWIGRRKNGAFDAASAKRLGLGDLRAFRRRQGPKGALDFSLVLCLDASSSVRSAGIGTSIADAGLALYEAARQMDGLDVALCVYGSGVYFGLPFDFAGRSDARSKAQYERALRSIRGGHCGGTMEADAIVWSRAVTRKRAAEGRMIVVITDGQPHAEEDVEYQIALAANEGIVTGGIGVGWVNPAYHRHHVTVREATVLPTALGTLVRQMMKGGR